MNEDEIKAILQRLSVAERHFEGGRTGTARERRLFLELKDKLAYLQENADTGKWQPPALSECVCGGNYGYYLPEWPNNHPNMGERRPCICLPEVQRKKKKMLADKLWKTANIPLRFVDARLAFMDTTNPETKRMVDTSLRYLAESLAECGEVPESLEPYVPDDGPFLPEILALFGMYGTGKTMIATAIVRGLVLEGIEARYTYVPDLLDQLRASYRKKDDEEGDYYELIEELKNITVLVLDDVGSEKSSDWADEQIDKIVDYRYRECKRTVITTNMEIKQLPPRTADRLREATACTCVVSKAPSYRANAKRTK